MVSLPPRIAGLLEGGTRFKETTLQGYRSAWRDLLKWIRAHEPHEATHSERSPCDEPLLPPPTLIADYLRDRMDLAWSTLATRRQAIRFVYQELGEEDPFLHSKVDEVWEQIVDEKRQEPAPRENRLSSRDHSPADVIENGPSLLRDHLPSETQDRDDQNQDDQNREDQNRDELKYLPEETACSDDLSGAVQTLIPEPAFDLSVLRDRAILLLIATTDQPRKSLVGIDLEDIRPPGKEGTPTRILVYDSGGDPVRILRLETQPEIRYCPNRAVAAWILAAGLKSGPLFRPFNPRGGIRGGRIRPQTLNLVTKRWAEEAGFAPSDWSMSKLREQG